jgi:hypothetical protein
MTGCNNSSSKGGYPRAYSTTHASAGQHRRCLLRSQRRCYTARSLAWHAALDPLPRGRCRPANPDPRPHEQDLACLRQQLADLSAQFKQLQCPLAVALVVDRDKQAEFAALGQVRGVSLTAIYVLLRVLLGSATSSLAKLGRFSYAAGRRAGTLFRASTSTTTDLQFPDGPCQTYTSTDG